MNGLRLQRWLELFLPDEEERDERFRAEIARLSVIGLRVVGWVCLSGAAYFALVVAFGVASARALPGGAAVPLVIATLGATALGASYWLPLGGHARWAGTLVGFGVALAQVLGLSALVERPELAYALLSGVVTGVMLIGTAAFPLKPVHMFGLGSAITLTCVVFVPILAPAALDRGTIVLYVGQVVVLCVVLTAIVYRQRVLAYRARRDAGEALEELRRAQARLLVSENAHAQGRFAAALSHELNTPLGALGSALDTLVHVCKKEGLFERERYREVLSGAEQAGRGSAGRLEEIVARMSYLTNLDRASEQSVDVNELCQETAASLRGELEAKAELKLDFGRVPRVRCRPQHVSAVIGNLLRNAAAAIERAGHVWVSTRESDGAVHVEVRDDGRGISRERLRRLFEPTLQVDGGRVAAVNWGLFVCRTIVTEHGGELTIDSEVGVGTTARISLPTASGRTIVGDSMDAS